MAVRFVSMRVTENKINGGKLIEILRDIDQPDGTVARDCWTMPAETLSIRAGEYGLDPVRDQAAVWDLIHGESLDGHTDDGDEDPPLYTAPSVVEARRAHQERMAARHEVHARRRDRRTGERAVAAADQHDAVLDQVLEALVVDRELVELAGRHVAMLRARKPPAPPTLKEQLRAALQPAEPRGRATR